MEQSDEDWYLEMISTAKSIERLRYLAMNIDYDKFEEMEYTRCEETMARLRKAWGEKAEEVKNRRE